MKNKRWNSFYERFSCEPKLAYNQAEPPNALPASWRCPGQPSMALDFFTLTMQFASGHGGYHSGYVRFSVAGPAAVAMPQSGYSYASTEALLFKEVIGVA